LTAYESETTGPYRPKTHNGAVVCFIWTAETTSSYFGNLTEVEKKRDEFSCIRQLYEMLQDNQTYIHYTDANFYAKINPSQSSTLERSLSGSRTSRGHLLFPKPTRH